MTEGSARQAAIAYWMRKASEALRSARSELDADRFDFAVNRAYYACFYAASAVLLLLRESEEFVQQMEQLLCGERSD